MSEVTKIENVAEEEILEELEAVEEESFFKKHKKKIGIGVALVGVAAVLKFLSGGKKGDSDSSSDYDYDDNSNDDSVEVTEF